MPYYDTIEEDLARAKQILADGTPSMEELRVINQLGEPHVEALMRLGGTIYGKDIYAAYQLLKSFVEEVERLQQELADACASFTASATGLQRQLAEAQEALRAERAAPPTSRPA